MHDPCLILIDWQKGFRDSKFWGPRNNPKAEKKAESLLVHWRRQNWPVIFVRHDSIAETSILRPGQSGNELEDFCQPRAGETVYSKTVNSAFIGTTLEDDLRKRSITDLVFSGVTTDHCVSTSVRMAANLGFTATIVSDACYTHDRQSPDGHKIPAQTIHDVHLTSLQGEFATIRTLDEILESEKST
jgi:nicotinamidase-related amidase